MAQGWLMVSKERFEEVGWGSPTEQAFPPPDYLSGTLSKLLP